MMQDSRWTRRTMVSALALGLSLTVAAPMALAQQPPGTLRVAVIADIANFDPHQFSSVNASLIKNLYDSLIEYTPEGKASPEPCLRLEDRARQQVRHAVAAQGREVPQRWAVRRRRPSPPT